MMTSDIFDLSPDEFRAQEEAERIEAQQRREAEERKIREAAEEAERKKQRAMHDNITRWTSWLTCIGIASRMPYQVKVLEPYNSHRPCVLLINDIQIPVSEGYGKGFSLEITMPWHTARRYGGQTKAETVRSRMKKNGEFNWQALGSIAARFAEAQRKYQIAEAAKMSSAGMVKQLAEDLKYSGMEPSTDPAKPVTFKFSIVRNMTKDEARRAVTLLRDAGLLQQ